ncbi:MAG TPA: TetR/AcrR family transcriptional regulator [Ilumatobacteraceae bacterium]|nr:TetR/AcrR family transcriptional regulator [Ilumatobacteraceae bacterium]
MKAETAPRRQRRDGAQTRAKVLDAVVETILDEGYYRASSNEFARRAGVTWGTIQHQFGTREQLLLAVLSERWDAWDQTVAGASVVGSTLEERLDSVFGLLQQHYGNREMLAMLQILLDLSLNPDSSAETRAAAARHGEAYARGFMPLFADALGEYATADNVRYAFLTIRGALLGNLVAIDLGSTQLGAGIRRRIVAGIAAVVAAAD